MTDHSVQKKMKLFYFCAAVFLVSLFVFPIFRPIATIYHEEDLWWMLPTISHISENNSFLETVKIYLFDPYPTNRGEISMNLYILFVLSFFGSQAGYFIFTSLVIHFSCAILLYLLVRKIGFEFRIAFFTALTYAAIFIHFDHYIFTMASQHRIAIFFTLLVLNLYLETTKRIDRDERWKSCFWFTLFVNLLASFCQAAILILPSGILAHILICSKDGNDRIRKYDIWLPLFITYFGYILMRFFYYGCPHLEYYLHLNEQTINIYSPALFWAIFASAVGSMLLFRLILRLCDRYRLWKALKNLLVAGTVLYLFAFLAACFNRKLMVPMPHGAIPLPDLLSPYNFIMPIVGVFAGFLEPLKVALSIDSAQARCYIPVRSDPLFILLSLFFIWVFYRRYFVKYKATVIFFVPYLLALRSMTEFFLWDRHGTIPSRYFVYITPFFSILFCSVFIYLYFLLIDKTRLKSILKDFILILLFIGLCVPNILAVKFEMFKSRLLHTRYIYDYIRISELIKEDLTLHSSGRRNDPKDIYVDGVLSMPFGEGDYDFSPVSPLRFDNFRYTFAQAFDNKAMLDINVNRLPEKNEEGIIYKIDNIDIKDTRNINVDEFSRDRDEAARELSLKHYDKAAALFQRAMERRPFLFRYVLAGYKLEDSSWITNGRSIRQWVGDMTNYTNPQKKIVYVSKILNTEIDDYIECLFYASYLKYLAGKGAESANLFSQIRFLDSNPKVVFSLLKSRPGFSSDKQMPAFLNDAEAVTSSSRPDSHASSFAKFISGLLVNKDVFK